MSIKGTKELAVKDPPLTNHAAKCKNPTEWFISDGAKTAIPSPMENRIRTILNSHGAEYHCEVSFRGLRCSASYMRFDFYFPILNLVIEYDGQQWHSSDRAKEKDKLKDIFCRQNKIRIVRLNKQHAKTLEVEIVKLLL